MCVLVITLAHVHVYADCYTAKFDDDPASLHVTCTLKLCAMQEFALVKVNHLTGINFIKGAPIHHDSNSLM